MIVYITCELLDSFISDSDGADKLDQRMTGKVTFFAGSTENKMYVESQEFNEVFSSIDHLGILVTSTEVEKILAVIDENQLQDAVQIKAIFWPKS